MLLPSHLWQLKIVS